MAEYGVEISIRDVKSRSFYGPQGVIEIDVQKGDPTARQVARRLTYIYCHMLAKDYVRRPDGSSDMDQHLRRHVQLFRMTPDELFALADYVKSQLADTPPPETESIAPTEATE